MLSDETVCQYFREGYLLVRGLVDSATITSVRAAAEATPVTPGGGWTPRIFDYEHPERDTTLHQLLWNPAVTGAAGQLLGTTPFIYYGMLAIVPPHGGTGLPWHQDNMYSPIYGGALNIFIALDTIAPEQANLWVAPQSHRFGIQRSHEKGGRWGGHREADEEPENGFCLPALAPGDACIFTRDTLHRSLVNTTDQPRYAYAAQFCAANARYLTDGTFPFRALDPAQLVG